MRQEIAARDLAAERTGTLHDPDQREADRQVGWAYRLLHAYGTGEELSFAEGSDVHTSLLEAGAQEYDIPLSRPGRGSVNAG